MYNISIGKRTFIVVFCTTLILFSMLYLISDLMYMEGYKELEEQNVVENVSRVSDALSARINALDTLCYDWAAWDDTYEFAKNQNSDFVDINLGNETFINMDVNLIIILNSDGQIIYAHALDLTTSTEIAIPDLRDYLSEGELLNQLNIEDHASGIISCSDDPMLIASRPILTSHAEGPSTGTLIMGRFLDSSILETLSETTHLSIAALPLNNNSFPIDLIKTIETRDESTTVVTEILSKDSIVGYMIIKDINDNPTFVFRVDMPRQMYAQGQKTLAYLNVSLLFISVVFFFVFVFVVKKTVLNRLTSLSENVNSIGEEGNASKRVPVSGKDELASLAININKMLESVEKSETEIRAQKEFIDGILSNTPNAVLVIDKYQNIILTNSAFNTMFNLDTANLKSKKISSIVAFADLSSKATDFMKDQSAEYGTQLQYTGDGIRKTLTVSFTRMKEEELFLIIFTDITTEMDRQDRLYLTDRLATVGEMASGVAHELNNPLSSIVGLSELLTDEKLSDEVRQDVVTINSEARRAAEVVKNMLSFARKHTSTKELLQMNQVIDDVLKLRAYNWTLNNITVECNLSPDLPRIMADYFQMQQVFLNIVLNAEQSMIEAHSKGILKITSEKIDDLVKLSFSDDGMGIDQKNLTHIFDPFFTTKEVGSGTGLGLSICYGIVAAHGGRIYVESEIGKGATFIIELPVEQNPVKEKQRDNQ